MRIENDKLTPDMQLSRSGSTMLFRKDYGDRQFANEKNSDVVIKAPRPELVARLIDNEWCWVNECPECIGKEPVFPYVKCEKHNVCVTCGIKRKDLKETPWGHRNGFVCKPCEDARVKSIIDAFQATEINEDDFNYRSDVKCLYCGYEFYPDDFYETGTLECGNCSNELHVEVEYEPYYTITKPEKAS